MFSRALAWIGKALQWMVSGVAQVIAALNGGRDADASASKLYERQRDDYRP